MRIPYESLDQISKIFPFPKQFYRVVHDILISADGLGLLIHFLACEEDLSPFKSKNGNSKMPSPQTVYMVIKHITFRTLQFNKLFEFIRVEKEIIRGLPTIGISGAQLSKKTIIDALSGLYQCGCIVKLQFPQRKAITKIYGLNLPFLINLLDLFWFKAIKKATGDRSIKAKSLISLQAQRNIKAISEYLEHFEAMFNRLWESGAVPIDNIESFSDELKKCCPPRNETTSLEEKFKRQLRKNRVKTKDLMPEKWKMHADVVCI